MITARDGAVIRSLTALALAALATGIAPAAAQAPGAAAGTPPRDTIFPVVAVESRPVLLDSAGLARAVALLRREPVDSLPSLTNLRFVVDVNGLVDPSRLWTSFGAESASVRRAAPEFLAVRFRPGIHRGMAVRTEVGVPVLWTGGRASPMVCLATWNPGVDSLPNVAAMTNSVRKGHVAREGEVVAVEEAEVKPRLRNFRAVQREIRRVFPPRLRTVGGAGETLLKVVITRDGRVDPASISVVYSSHPLFSEAAIRVATTMQFDPARIGGCRVPVLIGIPISWTPMRAESPPPEQPS